MSVTPIPRTPILDLFKSLLPANTPVIWDGDPVPYPGPRGGTTVGLTCTLAVNAVQTLGIDEFRKTFTGSANVSEQNGMRTFTLSVRVDDYSGHSYAYDQLEFIRTRLQRPSSRAALRAAGLALIDFMPLIDLDASGDNRVQSRSTMDLKLAMAMTDADTGDDGNWIATVDGSNKPIVPPT